MLPMGCDTKHDNCTKHDFVTMQTYTTCDLQACRGDCDNIVQHSCLTYQGQGGSSLWSRENNRYIHAIATRVRTASYGPDQNVGIMLNAFVYNTIAGWYSEDEDTLEDLTSPSTSSWPSCSRSKASLGLFHSGHTYI